MEQIYGVKNMRYRSTLFSIFSYLLVLFVAISLIGSAQALTIPDGQRGSFQSGKIQGVLGFDPVTAPENCGMFSGEARNSGFFAHPRLQAKSDILPPAGPFNTQLQISDIHPSVGAGTRSQLVDSIIQNRMSRNSNQDAGHSSLMPFSGTGTVTYIDLEGGFYGIITESGVRYLPLNLPDGYALEGLFVDFTARIAEESTTIAMWGTPVHLLSVAHSGGDDAGAKFGIAGSWVCTGYRDGTGMRTPLPGTGIVADFGTDGRVTGTSGCNLFFAEYEAGERSLDIGAAGMTEMYCLEPVGVMDQEQIFLNLLCSAETFDISDGQLTIQDATGQSILTFEKA